MKTVLCYGDSNTWGYDPVGCRRHDYEDRWTTVLQKRLGEGYLVIPEGLNGRTTVWEDPIERHKNGAEYLVPCLESHKPLDLVILFLGTNDLKHRFSLSARDIAAGVGTLVDLVRKSDCGPSTNAPEILVLIPPEVRALSNFKHMFEGGKEKSLGFAEAYSAMGGEKNVTVFDIGASVRFSDADGIHFEKEQLAVLGSIVADKVRTVLA